MDFVPQVEGGYIALLAGIALLIAGLALGILGALLLVSVLWGGESQSRHTPRRIAVAALLALLVGAGCMIGSTVTLSSRPDRSVDRNGLILQSIEDSYGLTLSEGQYRNLDYPTRAPSEDFELYGNAALQGTEGEGIEKQQIVLYWDQGKLFLARLDSGALEPLKLRE